MSAIVPHRWESILLTDLLSEKLYPIPILARDIPGRGGNSLHPGSMERWARVGVRGERLEVALVGGQLCSSKEAVARFIERVTAARMGDGDPVPQPSRTTRQRQRASERDAKALEAMGA
jgi:Protein of unknown function (DUF1580)